MDDDIEQLTILPTVSADGAIVTGEARDFAGSPVSERRGGSYSLRRDLLLRASEPLPPRLLLAYSTNTHADRRKEARIEALLHAFVAAAPLAGILHWMGCSGYVYAAVMAGIATWAYWKIASDPEKVWQYTAWLDFEKRTWCSRRSFANKRLAPQTTTLALDELAIHCHQEPWEHGHEKGVSHEVALSKVTDLRFPELGPAPRLHLLHSSDVESEARDFARSVAAMWGMKNWK